MKEQSFSRSKAPSSRPGGRARRALGADVSRLEGTLRWCQAEEEGAAGQPGAGKATDLCGTLAGGSQVSRANLRTNPMPKIGTQIRQSFPDFGEDFDTIEDELSNWDHRLGSARSSVAKGEDNPHAAPAVARALFETCCAAIYLQRELLPRVKKGKLRQVHELVFRSTLGSIGVFGEDHIRPVKVEALIRSARSELKDMDDALPVEERFNAAQLIDIYYGPLTEFTHPNWPALNVRRRQDVVSGRTP